MGPGRGYGVQRHRGPYATSLRERLMRHMEPEPNSGCWLWTGSTVRGYGRIEREGGVRRKVLAHRAMWTETYGEIPPDRDVLNTCDMAGCVNPQHLWLGTHSDNMQDAMRKGRRVLRKDAMGRYVG